MSFPDESNRFLKAKTSGKKTFLHLQPQDKIKTFALLYEVT